MKKSVIICVVVIAILLILAFVLLCGPTLFGGTHETTDPADGNTTIPDTTLNNIQEGVDWDDEIDLAPTDTDTTVDTDPTEPLASDGSEQPTDPPTTGKAEKPTDPPTTAGNQQPTDAPTEEPTQEAENQTTQDGIDLPMIPG